MTTGPKVRVKFHVAMGRAGHKAIEAGTEKPKQPQGRIPRISRLMALAIRFEQLIQDGVVRDQADIAKLAQVSRARVTQIMNLLMLAPAIQESLLLLPHVKDGEDPFQERQIRRITPELNWHHQRLEWHKLTQSRTSD